MLDNIFEVMLKPGILKYLGSFLWGIASVILSPCGIAAIPLVVGYIENTENPTRLNAFKISCAFCVGIIFNLMLIAFIMSGFGILLGGYERFLTVITSVVFIVMGLHLIGILKLRFKLLPSSGSKGNEERNLKGALTLGILSGLAVGPCSIAYVSPILSIAMSGASKSFLDSVILIFSYALGYSFVLIISGTFAQLASKWLQSERGDTALKILNIICGIILIISGIYLLSEMRFFV